MIARDVVPIGHVPVYRRIDIRYPGRKRVITDFDIINSGDREPDLAIYRRDYLNCCWVLKDGA